MSKFHFLFFLFTRKLSSHTRLHMNQLRCTNSGRNSLIKQCVLLDLRPGARSSSPQCGEVIDLDASAIVVHRIKQPMQSIHSLTIAVTICLATIDAAGTIVRAVQSGNARMIAHRCCCHHAVFDALRFNLTDDRYVCRSIQVV